MTYDIDLLKNQNESNVTGFDFKESGKLISGRSKVVKRFTQLLLTIQGSDKTDPEAGCQLLAEVTELNMEIAAVEMCVQNAINLCTYQLITDQPEDTPPSERLVAVHLVKTEAEFDRCDVTLDFEFADTVSALVPVTIDYNNA